MDESAEIQPVPADSAAAESASPRPGERINREQASGEPDKLDELSSQFSARIEGLRELLEVISPHVAALDRPEGIAGTIDQSGLSAQGKTVVKDLFVSRLSSLADSSSSPAESAEDNAPSNTDTNVTAEEVEAEVKAFADVAQEEPDGVVKVLQRLMQGYIAPRSSLLHGSLLTVAVASFEFLIAGLFALHLTTYPKQLKDDEREFSLADLVELASIEDARHALIERRVDGFMRHGLDDWSRWSQQTLGEAFDDLCLDFTHLNEVFQRRHVVVHSAGAVSRIYLERVDFSDGEEPEVGQDLPVTASYLQSALDELEVIGHGLVALARSKWTPSGPDGASAVINTKVFDLLKAQRWELARKLAEVGGTLGQSDSDLLMITVNGWIARKRLGELDACKEEIASWDVSALETQFKLARACLLDETNKAIELLAVTISESDAPPRHVWRWPLLDDLRSDSRFIEVFAKAGYTPPENGLDPDSEDAGKCD